MLSFSYTVKNVRTSVKFCHQFYLQGCFLLWEISRQLQCLRAANAICSDQNVEVSPTRNIWWIIPNLQISGEYQYYYSRWWCGNNRGGMRLYLKIFMLNYSIIFMQLGAVQVSRDHILAYSRHPPSPLWSSVIIWDTPPPPLWWSRDIWMNIYGKVICI